MLEPPDFFSDHPSLSLSARSRGEGSGSRLLLGDHAGVTRKAATALLASTVSPAGASLTEGTHPHPNPMVYAAAASLIKETVSTRESSVVYGLGDEELKTPTVFRSFLQRGKPRLEIRRDSLQKSSSGTGGGAARAASSSESTAVFRFLPFSRGSC